MVAVIHSSKSVRNALHYNENKVRQNVAKLIHSGNYTKDTHLLGFTDKINRLERLIALNQQTKINSVHISLNFDLADKLNEEKLKLIADKYITKIGFSEQPYLVYQHNDAGHPHVHIVTTNIKSDGSRISLHNLGKNQSEKARKEIEKEFDLIKAENRQKLHYELKPVDAQRVQYGKAETKRAITTVLSHVLPTYKYTSLAELNAVLKQYNVVADRGKEKSRIYCNNGLVYHILNGKGKKIGVPVKASLIYNEPTLKNISSRFEQNDKERQTHKRRLMSAIDFALLKDSNKSLEKLMLALQKEKIQLVLRENDKGVIYGITYVDFQTKCVFNGSDLGKQYSANAIQQRCNAEQQIVEQKQQVGHLPLEHKQYNIQSTASGISKIFDELIQPEQNQFPNEPPEQRKFKKRKRKQRHSHN